MGAPASTLHFTESLRRSFDIVSHSFSQRQALGTTFQMIFHWWRDSTCDVTVGMPRVDSDLFVAVVLTEEMLLRSTLPKSRRSCVLHVRSAQSSLLATDPLTSLRWNEGVLNTV
eukprot:1452068-Amphidinium_carterae.1